MPYQIAPQVMPERMEDMSPLLNALQSMQQFRAGALRNNYQQDINHQAPAQLAAQLQRLQLGNQTQQLHNSYLPQMLQANLQYTQLMNHYSPLLAAAKLQAAQSAGQTPVQKAYAAFKRTQPGSNDREVYAAQLRTLLQPKAGTSISFPDGQTISMGGPAGQQGLPEFLQSNPNLPKIGNNNSISTLQKGGRGNAGLVLTQRDKNGQVIRQNSAQTTKNLTQNQQAAQALQLVSPLLHHLTGLTAYNYPGGGLTEKFDELLNHSGDTQPNLQNKILSESTLAQIQDSLGNAFNVPKTSEGFKFIQDAVKPLPGERSDQFVTRLKQNIIPELSNRYAMTRNTLVNGVPLPPHLNFDTAANASSQSPQFSSVTSGQIADYAKRHNQSIAEVIRALKRKGVK